MRSPNNQETSSGTVLEIQRMSMEDGPGIRTTVFMKVCPLSCSWCHNPESISPKPQVQWLASQCIGCGLCIDACPEKAHIFVNNPGSINRKLCRGCGACADACPSGAMALLGQQWHANALVDELSKDAAYYAASGGGVTISGGESTIQKDFVVEVLEGLRRRGIHTAIDTCGVFSQDAANEILPRTRLVLFDIKLIDPGLHKRYTGSGNERILENLAQTASMLRTHRHPDALWVRTPVIPGATDSDENIYGIGRFLSTLPKKAVSRWELCAFNHLCADKYIRLGRTWDFAEAAPVASHTMEHLAAVARAAGIAPEIVAWTGTTALAHDNTRDTDPVTTSDTAAPAYQEDMP